MSKYFVTTDNGHTYLTVEATTPAEALDTARGAVSKEVFQHNLKNLQLGTFEIVTRDVQGVAAREFPEDMNPLVLEITVDT